MLKAAVIAVAALMFLSAPRPSPAQNDANAVRAEDLQYNRGLVAPTRHNDDPVTSILEWAKKNPMIAGIIFMILFGGGARGAAGAGKSSSTTSTKPSGTK
jgi:hypothetical protein